MFQRFLIEIGCFSVLYQCGPLKYIVSNEIMNEKLSKYGIYVNEMF